MSGNSWRSFLMSTGNQDTSVDFPGNASQLEWAKTHLWKLENTDFQALPQTDSVGIPEVRYRDVYLLQVPQMVLMHTFVKHSRD